MTTGWLTFEEAQAQRLKAREQRALTKKPPVTPKVAAAVDSWETGKAPEEAPPSPTQKTGTYDVDIIGKKQAEADEAMAKVAAPWSQPSTKEEADRFNQLRAQGLSPDEALAQARQAPWQPPSVEQVKRPPWTTWENFSLPWRFFFDTVAPTVGGLLTGKFANTDLLQLVKEYDKGARADPQRMAAIEQAITQQVEEQGLGEYAQSEWQSAMKDYRENVPDWQKMIAETPAYFAPGGIAGKLFWLPFTAPVEAGLGAVGRFIGPKIAPLLRRFAKVPAEPKPSMRAWGTMSKPGVKAIEPPIPEARVPAAQGVQGPSEMPAPAVKVTPEAVPPLAPKAEAAVQALTRQELKQEIYETTATLEALQEELRNNRARDLIGIIKRSGAYKGEVKDLTVKQFKDLTGREPKPTSFNKEGKISWEYILDEFASERGYASEEALKKGIEQAKRDTDTMFGLKAQLRGLQSELKALPKEVPPTEIPLETEIANRVEQIKAELPVAENKAALQEELSLLEQQLRETQIPTPVAGTPEAGFQPGMMGVLGKRVTPVGKGRVVQESLEDLAKLRAAKGIAAGPRTLPPLQPPTTGPAEAISRSQIMRDISEKLDVPIRQGHFRQRAVGIFKEKPEIIRIKSGEVRTTAHEVGHLLDTRYNLSGKITQKELAPLLTEYPKPKNKHKEALGEFLRYYITEPEKAASKAPKFSQVFETFLNENPELRPILENARDNYSRWLKMPATAKLDSVVSREPIDPAVSLVDRAKKLYSMLWDDLYKIQDVVKQTGLDIAAQEDPYKLATLIRGLPGKVSVFLEKGTFGRDLSKAMTKTGELAFKGKGLRQILEPIAKTQRDFSNYLVARRGLVLSARGIKTPLTTNEYKAAYRELNARFPQFAKSAEELYTYQKHVLEYAKESGLISDESFQRLLTGSKSYVPFHRVFEELQARGFMGKRMVDVGVPIKRIKGSERDIIDPLESIVRNTYLIMDTADRNQIGVALANLAGKNKLLGRMFEQVPTPMARVARVSASDLGIKIEGVGTQETDDMINVFRPKFFNEKGNIASVLMDGKRKYFQVEPDLYRALRAMDKEQIGWLVNMASYPAKWLRAGAVLSPEFWLIKNPLRDTMTAFVYSRYGFMPVIDTIRGVFSMLGKDKDYELWRMAGGVRSMMVSLDREYLQKTLPEVMSGKPPVDYVKHPLEALQKLAEFTESGTRIGEFKRAIKAGASPWEAGYASREVSLDFAKVGSATRSLNMMTAFWNANMRAGDKLIRSFRDYPVQTAVKATLGITLPSIGLYMANRNDPRWKEIPQWQKDSFWIVFAGDQIIRIPKPFELGMMFGSAVERTLEYLDNQDPKLFEDLADNAVQSGSPGFIPTAMLPIIENWTNHNFFRNQKLVPEGLTDEVPQLQYTGYTSEAAKKLGELVNYSPIKIDNLFRGYTAGLGQYALSGLDAALKGTGIVPSISESSPELADVPILRGAIVRDPYGSSSASVTRFYDTLEEYTKHENYLKAMIDKNNDAAFQSGKKAHPELLMQYDDKTGDLYSAPARYLRSISKQLSDIRKVQREVYDSPTLTADEKREKIDLINATMTDVARGALDTLKMGPKAPSAEFTSLEVQEARQRLARSKEVLKSYDDLDDKLKAYMNKDYPGFDILLAKYEKAVKTQPPEVLAYARKRYPQLQEYFDMLQEVKKQVRQKDTELETYLQEYRGYKPVEQPQQKGLVLAR